MSSELIRKTIPMNDPVTAEWGRTITFDDYNKMLEGFFPTDMDDKWAIYSNINAQGNAVIRICRSWLGNEVYVLTVKPGDPNNTEVKDWATIVDISWERVFAGLEVFEEEAKRTAVRFTRGLLRCEIENES